MRIRQPLGSPIVFEPLGVCVRVGVSFVGIYTYMLYMLIVLPFDPKTLGVLFLGNYT